MRLVPRPTSLPAAVNGLAATLKGFANARMTRLLFLLRGTAVFLCDVEGGIVW
jgi:hypothetical protein